MFFSRHSVMSRQSWGFSSLRLKSEFSCTLLTHTLLSKLEKGKTIIVTSETTISLKHVTLIYHYLMQINRVQRTQMHFRGEGDSSHRSERLAGSVSVVLTAELIHPEIIHTLPSANIPPLSSHNTHLISTHGTIDR